MRGKKGHHALAEVPVFMQMNGRSTVDGDLTRHRTRETSPPSGRMPRGLSGYNRSGLTHSRRARGNIPARRSHEARGESASGVVLGSAAGDVQAVAANAWSLSVSRHTSTRGVVLAANVVRARSLAGGQGFKLQVPRAPPAGSTTGGQ